MQSRLHRYCITMSAFHAASLFLQPVFAGMILSGTGGDPLLLHKFNAETAFVFCLLTLIGIAVAWRKGVISVMYPVLATAILLAEALQFHFGYKANLLFHVPLGVFVVTMSTFLPYALNAESRQAAWLR